MSDPSQAPQATPPRARRGGEQRDTSWHPKFLENLAEFGIVSHAAQACGHNRATAYRHRKDDKEFAALWDDADAEASDVLEMEIRRRAVDGDERPIYSKDGKKIGTIVERSDRLIMFLAQARNPRRFSQRHQLEHSTGQGGLQINLIPAVPPQGIEQPSATDDKGE